MIPTIPGRERMLARAVASVHGQTHKATAISIAVDERREGSWVTRQRALNAVGTTTWVQLLDDDDTLMPQHLDRVLTCAAANDADLVYSWFSTRYTGGQDPLGHFGKPFDAANPVHTTMTVLVRTALAQRVGFTPPRPGQIAGGEDWRFLMGCLWQNAHVVHLPERTWEWRWHGGNTSGRPDRW